MVYYLIEFTMFSQYLEQCCAVLRCMHIEQVYRSYRLHNVLLQSHIVHFLKFLLILFHLPVSIENRRLQVRNCVVLIRTSLGKMDKYYSKLKFVLKIL